MMARSRRTRSLKSSTQLSSSVTGCELGISDMAPRSVAKKPGTPAARRHRRRRGMRFDIDEPAVDLPIGRPAMDRRDRLLERPVVEHRAVDERGRGRVDLGLQVMPKGLGDELGAPRPGRSRVGHHLVHLDDPRRRKGARKRRGRARRKGERGRIVEIEVALDLAVRSAADS